MAAPVPGQDPTANISSQASQDDGSSYRPTMSPESHQIHESPSSGASSSSTSSTFAQQQQQSQPRARAQAHRRPSSPNASSAPITQASGAYTGGVVNRHPNAEAVSTEGNNNDGGAAAAASTPAAPAAATGNDDIIAFRVGVSEDRNQKCRRSMEDSHAFVYDFGGVKGQGYFAIFDGHAGKHAAEWCGANFHKYLLDQLRSGEPNQPIPDILNATFHVVDSELSKLSAEDGTHSGCTAVTAFLRLEDEHGNAVEVDEDPDSTIGSRVLQGGGGAPLRSSTIAEDSTSSSDVPSSNDNTEGEEGSKRKFGDGVHRERIKSLFGGSGSSPNATDGPPAASKDKQSLDTAGANEQPKDGISSEGVKRPARPKNMARRTLYTANVGDARAVLSRGGKAVRLTYDHKGSDAQEAKRITDAGGFVMNNRVNGVLAVTRSLGDSSMKEFVVGSPYTTETTLGDEDDFLIVACDGLWDVCEDQTAVDLIRGKDAQKASEILTEHALDNFSTDNLSVLVVSLQADRY